MNWKRITLGIGGLLLGASLASAQSAGVAPGIPSPSSDIAARSNIYRLDFESFYETDSGPCDTPSFFSELIRGTMSLAFAGHDGAFLVFNVHDANWLLSVGDEDTRISGSGQYRIGGLGPVPMERLTLTLRWGDEQGVRFDSVFVPADPSVSPSIDLIVREVDADVCFTRIVRVAASVVPPSQMIPYRVRDSWVSEQYSPLGPVVLRPLTGSFRLIDLPPEADTQIPVREAAVVYVRWHAPATSLADWPLRVNGAGIYRWGTVGPPLYVQQRLEADLTLVDGTFVSIRQNRFDSGWQPFNSLAWPEIPTIDIEMPQLDEVYPFASFDLFAEPVNTPGINGSP